MIGSNKEGGANSQPLKIQYNNPLRGLAEIYTKMAFCRNARVVGQQQLKNWKYMEKAEMYTINEEPLSHRNLK